MVYLKQNIPVKMGVKTIHNDGVYMDRQYWQDEIQWNC